MKKLLLLLVMMMLLPMVASADAVEIGGIYYNLSANEKVAEVTNKPRGDYKGVVVIPATVVYSGVEYNVTNIGVEAFIDCYGVTSITIPNGVTSIGNEAFEGCTGLNRITIPKSVRSIGKEAFKGCYGLDGIVVESGNKNYDSRSNCNAIIETASNTLISGCKNSKIPNGIKSIGEDAFEDCPDLTSITIPTSVTNIGQDAFAYCKGLTSISIPNSVKSIERYAFAHCTGLTSITIPNSVTSIGEGAFLECYSVTSIVVNPGSKYYDSRGNCNAIIETASSTLISGCKNSKIPNGVTSIGQYAFDGCTGLASISIPNGVTDIGQSAFHGCTGLTSITIPNSVSSIGQYAFAWCAGLMDVKIGKGIKSIGADFLAFCGKISNIYCYSENVPATDPHTFSGQGNITLHVPNSSIEKYKAASPWKEFKAVVAIR